MSESVEMMPSLPSMETVPMGRKELRDAADLSVASAYLAGARGIESAVLAKFRG